MDLPASVYLRPEPGGAGGPAGSSVRTAAAADGVDAGAVPEGCAGGRGCAGG
ncbi:hypothetical protein FAIPA1_390009 [Frankia sp. AiPs1]